MNPALDLRPVEVLEHGAWIGEILPERVFGRGRSIETCWVEFEIEGLGLVMGMETRFALMAWLERHMKSRIDVMYSFQVLDHSVW